MPLDIFLNAVLHKNVSGNRLIRFPRVPITQAPGSERREKEAEAASVPVSEAQGKQDPHSYFLARAKDKPRSPGDADWFELLPESLRTIADDIIDIYRREAGHDPGDGDLALNLWAQAVNLKFMRDTTRDPRSTSLRVWNVKTVKETLLATKLPKKTRDLSLVVGSFVQDLPPSTNARRLKSRRKQPWKQRPERCKGRDAHIRPRLDKKTNSIIWFWSDCFGKAVDTRLVRLVEVNGERLTLAQVQALALIYHDRVVQSWLWNVTAVCIAKRLIHKGHSDTIDSQDRQNIYECLKSQAEDLSVLEGASLLRPVALEDSSLGEELRAHLENAKDLECIMHMLKGGNPTPSSPMPLI